jgi:hypothetical protein
MTNAHLIMQCIAYIMTAIFAGFWLVANITASPFWKILLRFGAIFVIVYFILEILKVQY